ncbi:MAG: hypothetical protein Kow00117_15220 [Phototrophicales bacterium]|nr:MAG: hypothetical protein CUN56_01015 [Phototrophicales bacterium]RMG76735.1 MAG: DUF4177 domain-containing protein [Chloroflexota bacterium]
MQKWEYLVVYLKDSDVLQDQPDVDIYMDADVYTEKLSNYGKAGWELVSFTWEERGAKAAFKRPIRDA